MKDCITERDFNGFLEGSLDPESLTSMESHSKSCSACARKLGIWNELKEELHKASCINIPSNFKEKVMTQVSREKIKPASSQGSIKRHLALVFVLTAVLYSFFRPFLRPLASELISSLFKSLSVVLFNFLSFVGIDPAVLIRLFGNIMANMDSLLPAFMATTALMIIALLVVIIKGGMQGQTE